MADHTINHKTNFGLFFTKKKKANPTIPYSLISVPNMIQNAAQGSLRFSMKVKLNTIKAVIAGLNCDE